MKNKSWYKIEAKADTPPEVLIYGDIGDYDITSKQFRQEFNAIDADHIHLRINSRGGGVREGIAIHNIIEEHPAYVTAHIDSLAASISSFIPMAADKIIMAKNARMMIHKAWTIGMGNSDDFRKVADELDDADSILVDAYAARTGMAKREIKEMLAAETWLNPKKAKEMGFIDEIAGEEGTKAQFDLSPFQSVPDDVKALFGKQGSTEREIETLLRDAGVSKSRAKAAIAAIKEEDRRDADDDLTAARAFLATLQISTFQTTLGV